MQEWTNIRVPGGCGKVRLAEGSRGELLLTLTAPCAAALLRSGIPPAPLRRGEERTSRGYPALLLLSTCQHMEMCFLQGFVWPVAFLWVVLNLSRPFCTPVRICPGSLCTDNFVGVMLPGDLTEQVVHTPENPPETASHFAVPKTCLRPRVTGSVLSSSTSSTHFLQQSASAFDFLCAAYWKERGWVVNINNNE